jgi:CRP-like cAMP-binding protein
MAGRAAGAPAEGEAMTKEKLEKMMAPYRAIEEAGAKGKKGGVIGHSGMCVLEAFLTFRLRQAGAPGDLSLRMSREAIARAALLSPRTVGRTIQHLANLGLITVRGGKVYEINLPPKVIPAAELGSRPLNRPLTAP